MDRELATTIIKDYFRAWIEKDKKLFLSLIHKDIVVKECTGDMYTSKDIADKWFEGWHAEGNKVIRWDIFKHLYDKDEKVALVTWIFECRYQSNEYTFEGTSVIEFKDDLIVTLDEYQMEVDKKHPYGI